MKVETRRRQKVSEEYTMEIPEEIFKNCHKHKISASIIAEVV